MSEPLAASEFGGEPLSGPERRVESPATQSILKQPCDWRFDVHWVSNAIGQMAAEDGLTRVYSAEVEVFPVLGVWTQTYVRVYGDTLAR